MGETPYRKLFLPTMNFMVAIILLPLGIDLFEHVGMAYLGESLIATHPWLATAFAYVPIFILLFIYLKATLEPMEKWGFRMTKDWKWSLLIGVLSAVVIYLVDIAFGVLKTFDVPKQPEFIVALGFIFTWGVLGPLVEEILFRGMVQTTYMEHLKGAWKVHPAVFIAAGFEVFFHLSTPLSLTPATEFTGVVASTLPQLAYVFVFGAVGGYFYQRTGSILPAFLIHAIGNAGELILFWIF